MEEFKGSAQNKRWRFYMQKPFYGEYSNCVKRAKLLGTQLPDPLYRAVNAERTVKLVCHSKELFHKRGVKDIWHYLKSGLNKQDTEKFYAKLRIK